MGAPFLRWLVLAAALPLAGQTVSVELPAGIDPQSVMVEQFLTGPFGGVGGPVTVKGRTVQIATTHEGRRGRAIRLLVFAPGCAAGGSVLNPLPPTDTVLTFVCRKLPVARFRAERLPGFARVRLQYVPVWGNSFLGIMDGMVSGVTMTEGEADKAGVVEVEMPDWAADPLAKAYRGEAQWLAAVSHDGGKSWEVPAPVEVKAVRPEPVH